MGPLVGAGGSGGLVGRHLDSAAARGVNLIMDPSILRRQLTRIGRRLLVVQAVVALGWALAGAMLLLLAAVWCDLLWELPPGPRSAAVAAAPLLALVLLGASMWRTVRQCSAAALARQIDDAARAGGEVRS